jgi:hypothetical protein
MRTVPLSLFVLPLLAFPGPAQVTTKLLVGGLNRPIWAGAPRGDARVFIALKSGSVRVWENGALRATPFLSLIGRVSTGSEQGLLGMAFHPDYAQNGFVYVNYTELSGDTVVARFTVSASDPNVVDPTSESVVLTQNQPFTNHNGGDLHFGPDGYLYAFFGDGGSANDPACRAQKLTNLLGKVIRIDVDSATPYAIPPTNPFFGQVGLRQEIFHFGLRNPWRNSFDRLTGDLYMGDVGQDLIEEIDVAPAGSAGLNFGWKVMEATLCNSTSNCDASTPPCNDPRLVPPITELLHANGSFAITGGYVYRGCMCPSEYGKYFFADFADNRIRSLEYDVATGTVSNLTNRSAEFAPGGGLSITNIASFGEDGFGELLILDHSSGGAGEVFKMVPAGAVGAVNLTRNGSGVNQTCFTAASLPILGGVFETRVDAGQTAGARLTALFGYAAPSSGTFLGRNEILVDTASPPRLQLLQPSSGGTDVFRVPIPCNLALAGMTLSFQAAVIGNRVTLCNAIDSTTGHY